MAIDYKKEWLRFEKAFGNNAIVYSGLKGMPTIKELMKSQIKNVIDNREKLMGRYVRENIITEISGADKDYHHIKITNRRLPRGPIGTMYIAKKDFADWCKRRKEKSE